MVSEGVPGEDIGQKFGEAVRRRRLEMAMSQEELADLSGLHRTYISDVERATRNITLKSAAKIASSLNIPLADLVENRNGSG